MNDLSTYVDVVSLYAKHLSVLLCRTTFGSPLIENCIFEDDEGLFCDTVLQPLPRLQGAWAMMPAESTGRNGCGPLAVPED